MFGGGFVPAMAEPAQVQGDYVLKNNYSIENFQILFQKRQNTVQKSIFKFQKTWKS